MSQKGFTLIETAVAGLLLVVLGVIIVGLQYTIGTNQLFVWDNYINVDQVNSSVSQIVREIRTARPSDSGAYLLQVANDNEIIFYTDLDYDNQSERVRYSLSVTQLIKGIIEPEGFPAIYPTQNEVTKIISDNVRNNGLPVFLYFNSDWPTDTANNPLAQGNRISDTRIVGLYLRINSNPNKPREDYEIDSLAQIRMLKDNI